MLCPLECPNKLNSIFKIKIFDWSTESLSWVEWVWFSFRKNSEKDFGFLIGSWQFEWMKKLNET